MNLREMRHRKGQLVAQMRSMLDGASGAALSAEDESRYSQLETELEGLNTSIRRAESLETEERGLSASQSEPTRPAPAPATGEPTRRESPRASTEYRAAFGSYLVHGQGGIGADERRALEATNDNLGGYIAAPQQFVAELLKGVDDQVHLRGLATVIQLPTAESLGVPTLETDLDDADWTTELGTGSQDDAMRFGKRELRAHPIAKRVKISKTLLRKGAIDAEQLVRDRLRYVFGRTQERAYMTGNGVNRPLGIFVASSDGIPTSRDTTAASATAIAADELIDLKYALKPQYRAAARWLFHRDFVKRARKLKDTQNQYLWQPGLSSDRPDTILDLPFVESEFAPNTFTTGQYVAALGDFSKYWVLDSLDVTVQRLVELYAETNQDGFIGRYEGDGMPVLAEAFVRYKLG